MRRDAERLVSGPDGDARLRTSQASGAAWPPQGCSAPSWLIKSVRAAACLCHGATGCPRRRIRKPAAVYFPTCLGVEGGLRRGLSASVPARPLAVRVSLPDPTRAQEAVQPIRKPDSAPAGRQVLLTADWLAEVCSL